MDLELEKCLLEYLSQPKYFFQTFCQRIEGQLDFDFKDEVGDQFAKDMGNLGAFQRSDSKDIYNQEKQGEILAFLDKISQYNRYLKDQYKIYSMSYSAIMKEVGAVRKLIEVIGFSNDKNYISYVSNDDIREKIKQERNKLSKKITVEEEKRSKIRDYDNYANSDLQKEAFKELRNERNKMVADLITKPDQFYDYLLGLPEMLQKQHWKRSSINQIKQKIDNLILVLGPKDNNNATSAFNESVKEQVLNSLTELENFLSINHLEPYSDNLEEAENEYRKTMGLSSEEKIVLPRITRLTNTIKIAKDFVNSINLQKENNEDCTLTFSEIVKNRKAKADKAYENFDDIEKISNQQDSIKKNIQNYASISSAFSRNEQNSQDVKKALLDICEEYEALTLNDKEFSKILRLVRSYGNMDATASKQYFEEVNAIENIKAALTSYMEKIEEDNQKLLIEQDEAYKKLLKIKSEEERKKEIKELNDRFDNQDKDLDTKRHLALYLSNYFENMSRGDLVCPDFYNILDLGNIDKAKVKSGDSRKNDKPKVKVKSGYSCKLEDPEECYYINGAGVDVDLKEKKIDYRELYDDNNNFKEDYFYKKQKELSKQKTETEYYKDLPIFPHEPRPNDIQQGNLGDCYFLAGLSSVAAFRPQHIKDMIKDNGDGTATVRFYKQVEKDDQLVDIPVYVRVDKVKGYVNGTVRGASNCLWASIIERAYAISGLHLNEYEINDDEEVKYKLDCADKEELDKKYEELKPQLDAKETEEDKQEFLREEVRKQYPWLVGVKQCVKDHKLQYEYELQKWSPSMESISGGEVHMAMQTCFGLKYEAKTLGINREMNNYNDYDIKKALYKGAIVSTASDNDKSAGIDNHAFTVIGWYEKPPKNPGDTPVTMLRLRNPWGSSDENALEFDDEDKVTLVHKEEGIFDISSEQFAKHFQTIYINSSEELEQIPFLKQSDYNADVGKMPNQDDGILTQDAYVEYLRFARDIHEAITKTDAWYSHNSTQYKELLKESITFRECVAKSRNLKIESLSKAYNNLKLKADAYVNHLDLNDMSKRQKRRYDVCQTINDLEVQLQAKNKQPRLAIQKQFLEKLVAKAYKEKNTKIAEAQLGSLADNLLNKKVVRTALEKVNIHELKQAKDVLIESVMVDIKMIGKGVDKEAGFNLKETISLKDPAVNN